MDKPQSTLSLRVVNSDKLESGKQASCLFSAQGGVVGSSDNHHWSIQDQSGNISPSQFAIEWRDGAFCLRVLNGSVEINRSQLSAHSGAVRIQQGDEIILGTLAIKSHISRSATDVLDPLMTAPESLVSNQSNPLDDMLEFSSRETMRSAEGHVATTVANSFSHDPLQVLDAESLTAYESNTGMEGGTQLLRHDQYHRFSSPLSDSAKDHAMDQEFIDLPEISRFLADGQYATESGLDQQYVAIAPLMRGFAAPLSIRNTQEANDFLEEVGKTLKAAIEGLLLLQRSQHALRDKHLRPIEDNPLRLNMDYETTLELLFADQKSPVHLSAPAAVAECLHNVRLHHQANQAAIAQALATMLDAFSPERLLNRFAHYLRSHERQEKDAAWAWEMYKNYYRELASSRQQGFEKLFTEVYEQAYDQALRQGMRGSEP